MSYQSFSGNPGSSNSSEKLRALQLPEHLNGKRVLDLGCNEGFFSFEAKRRGAAYVLGVDRNSEVIGKANLRATVEGLSLDFKVFDIQKQELGAEQFDYVFLFSALHYMDSPAVVFPRICKLLKPSGTLILELGISGRSGYTVDRAMRAVDWRFFPSRDLLLNIWLKDFSARFIGPSVAQDGDPVPRYVYHCAPRKTSVIFIEGNGGVGKTTLSRMFSGPVISTDELFFPVRDANAIKDTIQDRYEEVVKENKNIWATWDLMKNDLGVRDYFVDVIVGAIRQCVGSGVVVVEGFVVMDLKKEIENKLGDEFRCWVTSRQI